MAVLSALVTALIGWQVVDYFCLKRNIKKMIDERLDALTRDYQTVLGGIVRLNLHSHYLKGDCALLTDNCFECLQRISKCENETLRHSAAEAVMGMLRGLCAHYKDSYSIYEGKRSLYLYILSESDCPRKEDISDALNNSAEVPDEGCRIDFAEIASDEDIDNMLDPIFASPPKADNNACNTPCERQQPTS